MLIFRGWHLLIKFTVTVYIYGQVPRVIPPPAPASRPSHNPTKPSHPSRPSMTTGGLLCLLTCPIYTQRQVPRNPRLRLKYHLKKSFLDMCHSRWVPQSPALLSDLKTSTMGQHGLYFRIWENPPVQCTYDIAV